MYFSVHGFKKNPALTQKIPFITRFPATQNKEKKFRIAKNNKLKNCHNADIKAFGSIASI